MPHPCLSSLSPQAFGSHVYMSHSHTYNGRPHGTRHTGPQNGAARWETNPQARSSQARGGRARPRPGHGPAPATRHETSVAPHAPQSHSGLAPRPQGLCRLTHPREGPAELCLGEALHPARPQGTPSPSPVGIASRDRDGTGRAELVSLSFAIETTTAGHSLETLKPSDVCMDEGAVRMAGDQPSKGHRPWPQQMS